MTTNIVLADLLELSVFHNGVVLPRKTIEGLFSRHCVPLTCITLTNDFPVYFPGSATLIKYNNRYFLVCNRHQMTSVIAENISLTIPNGLETICLTSDGATTQDVLANESDFNEIVVLEFSSACEKYPALKANFVDYRFLHPDVPEKYVIAAVSYGYPTSDRTVDTNAHTYNLPKYSIVSKFDGLTQDSALHVLRPMPSLHFEPDGLSGGPTFVITADSSLTMTIHFAGIITRASKDRILVIKAGAIQTMLDHHIDCDPL